MIFVFFILAALLVYLSYRSLRGGIDYLNYFMSELAKPSSAFTPFATVIAPCKGLDEGLEQNLSSLIEQDYPAYEVIFVVDDKNDPASLIIEKLIHDRDTETQSELKKLSAALRLCGKKMVIASKAVDSSQKVENLREAILHASNESKVFVFVDSDARPSTDWLGSLLAPLEDVNNGAATGYRWFISKTPTFASELRNIWNASIASALGPNTKDNFCWGGSMAIRRDIFERLEIREKWLGTLSDDFTVTRAMNAGNLPIVFVPHALTASIENCTFREMIEFTTRQMKITRVYMPELWVMSFLGSALFCIVMIAAFAIAIGSRQNIVVVWIAIATIFVVTVLSVGKSWLRLKAARLALPEYEYELRKQFLPQLTLWLLSPLVFLYNSIAALVSRRMVWRGITYEMISPTETKVEHLNDDQHPTKAL